MAQAARRLEPRKTPRQARAHDTRERIVDAGARVFSRHGYAAGTTNRIAAEARLSVGSLYQYFPNKDAILVELVRRHVREGTAAVEAAIEATLAAAIPGAPGDVDPGDVGADVDVVALLAAVVDAVIATHAGDPALHQVLFEESPRPPELLAELHQLEAAAVDRAATLLAADPRVQVTDPVLAARLVVTTVESLVHRTIATRSPEPVDVAAFRRELLALLTRYLGLP
jgi:AcrR family transcriptional regulator